ncbi:UDP-glucose 4-epimerase GalE [Methylobacillus sp. MM3]|uniref:UDP-glucose 4-epimerase GalE n=1 Tax=Methylobacillus sp. MM3 TaxID=1848039 RepID=UPI0007DFF2E0|nr:UDP-glucose 4-epimerase GalE [Methylobacillus sp. MM3]OAJ71239.1 UDP-glucose 4-epimerase GalE [Methylobacillus sp. MM3]
MSVLVTGGAGYIGSHTVHQLVEAGHNVIVVDNFYSGHRWAVHPQAKLIEADAGDRSKMAEVIKEYDIQSVIHFAAHMVVPESVSNPLKYYLNNVATSANLLAACVESGVDKFIFSSTAAVYGNPDSVLVSEDVPTAPINPYGTTKLITEWMLRDLVDSHKEKFRFVALRYFNVAGAKLDGKLGQATPNATHLIKVTCEAACGLRESVSIFGTDYPTTDGTCIRDYIHVDDLARAHLDALAYLERKGDSATFNCGYGNGFSVRAVLETVQKVSGVDFLICEEKRRAGDPVSLIANADRIRQVLGWQPKYNDLELICRSAYQWESQLSIHAKVAV